MIKDGPAMAVRSPQRHGMRDWIFSRYFRGPEHPAKLRIVRVLSRTVLPQGGVVAQVAPGLRFRLHPDDWIEYTLLRGLPYEPLTLAFIESNLSPGDGAIFAGVNFGLHVAIAARAVGTEGLVLGVEPQPNALLRASANLALNGLEPRVVLIAAALGSSERLIHMAWSRRDNPGAASLLDDGPGFEVPMIVLDSTYPLLAPRPIRLLLLDVQGYEQHVLQGMNLRSGPDILILEVDRHFLPAAGGSPEQLRDVLASADYEFFTINGETPGDDWFDLPERNLVAVKKGAGVRWV